MLRKEETSSKLIKIAFARARYAVSRKAAASPSSAASQRGRRLAVSAAIVSEKLYSPYQNFPQ